MNDRLSFIGGVMVLSKYIKKHKRNFILFYIGWFFDTILTVITPIIFSIMIDEIVYYKNFDVFLKVSLVFFIMSVFSCMLYFLIYTLHHYLMSMYTFDIKLDLFKKLQSMNASYMTEVKTGDMINTLLSDTSDCMHFVIRNIIHATNSVIRGLFYITYIYIISVEAGITVTLFLPLIVYLTLKFSRKIRIHTDAQRENYSSYLSWLFEILKGITDIRLLSAEKTIRQKFSEHNRTLIHVDVKTKLSNLTSDKSIEFINLLLQLSIYGVCAYLAFIGKITIGSVVLLISFVFSLKDQTIFYLVHNFMDAQARLTRIARIKRFLSMDDENSWPGKKDLHVTHGHIEFKNIHFSYVPGKPVLQGFDAIIPSGSHTAFVGKSGCGKTTLASLLIGLHGIESGTIVIDGQDIADCSLKSIRQQIGIVQQEVLLFDGTIGDNLLLGNPKASTEDIWNACSKAGIGDFVQGLPQKLDTLYGKDGIGLSGGQRQRLAIARIYLRNPAIIIFDEATSALDKNTEQIIHDAWKELLKNRTAIVIAHRQSSVMLCDKAVLIEDGKAKVMSKPEDLLHNSSNFKELFAVKEAYRHV